jgi:16S rRNA (guanine527-N7)-methyltransferase
LAPFSVKDLSLRSLRRSPRPLRFKTPLRQECPSNNRQRILYNHSFVETSRIAALLDPFLDTPLTALQLDRISTYIDLLLRWNSRVNLTAIRTPDEIVTRHFGESLFAARHLFARSPASTVPSANPSPAGRSTRLLDLGSGAGFPGLPIKIWAPDIPVTLIESNNKKVAFLREVIRALTLTTIDVSPVRAEDSPAGQAEVVTLRAVERFAQILPIAIRLLSPGGRLALLISESQLQEATLQTPTLHWSPSAQIPSSQARILAIGTQTRLAKWYDSMGS